MMMANFLDPNNPSFPADVVRQYYQHAMEVCQYALKAGREGVSLANFEQNHLALVQQLAAEGMQIFLSQQGNGDLGETVVNDGVTMERSAGTHRRRIRTPFGAHDLDVYVYGQDLHQRIDFRPIDVRLEISTSEFSPLLQKFAMLLGTEQSYHQTCETLEAMFGQAPSTHSLRRIHLQASECAEEFLYDLPFPARKDEGAILVLSGDSKGVPMIREQPGRVPAFEKREFPGNCQMATLATVYSVDPFERTPEQIVEALFREDSEVPPPPRPKPVGKVVVGCLTHLDEDKELMPGDIQAFDWAAEQVRQRHRPGQPIVRLMDGQASLWETSQWCLDDHMKTIDILDIIHVSTYVWSAAKACDPYREHQEVMARGLLLRILQGEVGGVISGLRQRITKLGLTGKKRELVETACGYFENNRGRMKYDEYLKAGYPIATGVIEGACRHLVKDRLCRTGMRWHPPGSQAILSLRAIHQAKLADQFHVYRSTQTRKRQRKFRKLLKNYIPHPLWG